MTSTSQAPPRQGAAATALRLAGASYDEIAETLSLPSANYAREIVIEQLATRLTDADRSTLRAEEDARLARLLRSVWAKANNPDHPEHLLAGRFALSVVDRRIKLYGLDAPTEVVVHQPTMSEIDAWVARVIEVQTAEARQLQADVTVPELPGVGDVAV